MYRRRRFVTEVGTKKPKAGNGNSRNKFNNLTKTSKIMTTLKTSSKTLYKYTATIYEPNSLKAIGTISCESNNNAPSEYRNVISAILTAHPQYIRMCGFPKLNADHFLHSHFGGLIGRRSGYYEHIRYGADINRDERKLPIVVYIDILKEVNPIN